MMQYEAILGALKRNRPHSDWKSKTTFKPAYGMWRVKNRSDAEFMHVNQRYVFKEGEKKPRIVTTKIPALHGNECFAKF